MSDRNPSPAGGPLVEGPRDPEHDATASYALEPEYAESLTRRVLATTGTTVEVRSPLNDAPLAHIPQSSAADVAQAYARARKAQQAWSRVGLDERAAILLRLAGPRERLGDVVRARLRDVRERRAVERAP